MTPQEQITELKQLLKSMDLRLTKLEIQRQPTPQSWLNPSQIIDVVCKNWDLTEQSLRRRYPSENAKVAKIVAVHLIDTYTTISNHSEIASMFGNLSHSLVNYANKEVSEWRKYPTSHKLELEVINNIYKLVK